MVELWKDVEGYEGKYMVSNHGNIWSHNKQKIMVPSFCKDKYLKVSLHKGGEQKTKQVHRIVAEAFLENKDNKPQVNHRDGNKENNRLDNLEWVTAKENCDHAIKEKLYTSNPLKGLEVAWVKNQIAVMATNIKSGEVKIYKSFKEAAHDIGVTTQNISIHVSGKTKRVKGCYVITKLSA